MLCFDAFFPSPENDYFSAGNLSSPNVFDLVG